MDPDTRESLIARLPDHADHAAWHEFAELYEPLIYGIGRRHGLQPADANDLVQEVLSAVSESIEKFEPDQARGRFRTWLFRVARNQALTNLKKISRGGRATGDSDVDRILSNQLAREPSEQEFDAALRRRVFRWAARRVRESVNRQTWEAFSRTAIDGQAPKSVAENLGVEVGAIYLARSRVMARLRTMVQEVSHESVPSVGDSKLEIGR